MITREEALSNIRELAEDNYEDVLDMAEDMGIEPYTAIDEYIKEFQSVVLDEL